MVCRCLSPFPLNCWPSAETDTANVGQVQGHPTICSEFEFPTPQTDLVPASEYADGQIQVTPPAPGTSGNPPESQPTPSNTVPNIFLTTTPASGSPPAQTTMVPPGVGVTGYSKPPNPSVVVANAASRPCLSAMNGYMGLAMGGAIAGAMGLVGGIVFV